MGKHLVLAGGGHAHLETLKTIRKFVAQGHRVTLVNPTPFQDYSGMGPGLLSGRYRLTEVRFNIARMTTIGGGVFVEASAVDIDPVAKKLLLDNGASLGYDIVSFNCGSRVSMKAPAASIGKTIFPAKPVANLYLARQKIIASSHRNDRRLRLLVVGGGPTGCEVTGNLQQLIHEEAIDADLVQVSGNGYLDGFGVKVRNRTRSLLARKPFRLLEGVRVARLLSQRAELDDGRQVEFDVCILASGIVPITPCSEPSLSPEGAGLIVNQYLQSPVYPEIFGGGDCIEFRPRPLAKVGVHAVRQGPVLRHNLLAALGRKPLIEFQPQKEYLLIFNLGLGRAVASGYGFSWSGQSALCLKSWLDKRFVRTYRESG